MNEVKTISVPVCPECGGMMVFTFAFIGQEYACLPCGRTEEFMTRKSEFPLKDHDALKKLWKDDLHWLALRKGGATCREHDQRGCKVCAPLDYKPKYYLSNVVPDGETGKP